MKTLFVDVETSPNQAFCWGIWQQNISINHIIESSGVLCFAAKWAGKREVHFDSVHQSSKKMMLKGVHSLMSEADVVVTYNGKNFDLPVLNREFLLAGMKPPAPSKQVDMLRVAKGAFRFQSNKLEYVSRELGLNGKTKHEGFQMWISCMNDDPAAWVRMERYNKNDVVLLEKVYERMKPWIKGHPNVGAFDPEDIEKCPHCGSKHLQRRGVAITRDVRYQRYQCLDCGAWARGKKALSKARATLQGIS